MFRFQFFNAVCVTFLQLGKTVFTQQYAERNKETMLRYAEETAERIMECLCTRERCLILEGFSEGYHLHRVQKDRQLRDFFFGRMVQAAENAEEFVGCEAHGVVGCGFVGCGADENADSPHPPSTPPDEHTTVTPTKRRRRE